MNSLGAIPNLPPVAFFAIFIWSLVWKGVALWRAAKNNQPNWFIAILILSTIGILEIVYLFFFCKDKLTLNDFRKIKLPKLLSR